MPDIPATPLGTSVARTGVSLGPPTLPDARQGLSPAAPVSQRATALKEAARELEATFLAEMLKSAGFGESRESMGGGAGEDQFTSFLVLEQAKAMVDAGGIGLSETLYNALKERENNG